jgi:hypothetical protein
LQRFGGVNIGLSNQLGKLFGLLEGVIWVEEGYKRDVFSSWDVTLLLSRRLEFSCEPFSWSGID